MEGRVDQFITPPTRSKRIAIVGGGPGGMKTAIEAAIRGHQVTLYEKADRLGGQLTHADYPDFKYPLKAFKDYLIHQMERYDNLVVRLGTEATPEALEAEGYDEIVVAIGSKPIVPAIQGIDGPQVHSALWVYGHVDELDHEVVIIGGGEIGVETGIYLARQGRHVTILEMREDLALDATPIHYRTMVVDAWQHQKGLDYICKAKCCRVDRDCVSYEKGGKVSQLFCGSVVYAAGMQHQREAAWGFYGSAPRIRLVGDCETVGNVQTVIRSAYSTGVSL